MIPLRRFLFIISLFMALPMVHAQEQEIDSLKTHRKIGLRLGFDLFQPIYSFFSDTNDGFEFVADARVYKDLYAALEVGFNNKTSSEDYFNFTTKGTYYKFGANYNLYDNWAGMTNEIYIGVRYALSYFDQTLNNFTPDVYGTYFNVDTIYPNTTYKDLDAQWTEFVIGIKAETLKNLYLGFSFSFKILISSKEPENFQNLYIPGFYNVSTNNMGFGFNYTISYLIPFSKNN